MYQDTKKTYTVVCKNCGKSYESSVNRAGICSDCKRLVRGRTNTKYRDSKYDRITLYIPKGSKDSFKEYVSSRSMSMNEFLNSAVNFYTSVGLLSDSLGMTADEFIERHFTPFAQALTKENEKNQNTQNTEKQSAEEEQ